MAFCPNCKTVVRDDNETCRLCNGPVPQQPPFDPSRMSLSWKDSTEYDDDPEADVIYPLEEKSIFITVVLNVLFTGLGQMYLGQKGKGFVLMSPGLFGVALWLGLKNSFRGLNWEQLVFIGGIMSILSVVKWGARTVAMVDGVLIANKLKQDKVVRKGE